MKKRFLVIQTFKTPYALFTGHPKNPYSIQWKMFKKGETVVGKIHQENNKPAYVLTDDALVIPLNAIKEVQTKEVGSQFDAGEKKEEKVIKKITTGKFKYIDSAILGGLVAFGVCWFGVKKTWFVPDKKNRLIAIGVSAAAAAYLVYRFSDSNSITIKKDTETIIK